MIDPQSTYIAILAIFVLFAGGAFWAIRYQRSSGYVTAENRLLALVEQLRAEVTRQSAVIDDLDQRYKRSLISEADANRRIRELENTLDTVRARVNELEALNATTKPSPYHVPMLHIIGNEAFGETDRTALAKAKIHPKRIVNATRKLIEDEMERRRLDGSTYRWITISAHMGEQGVLLEAENDWTPAEWWNRQMVDAKIVFLNGCKGLAIADGLAGMVAYVVSLGEEVENETAANFAYAFWRRVASGTEPSAAFWTATREIPAVAQYADIRTG